MLHAINDFRRCSARYTVVLYQYVTALAYEAGTPERATQNRTSIRRALHSTGMLTTHMTTGLLTNSNRIARLGYPNSQTSNVVKALSRRENPSRSSSSVIIRGGAQCNSGGRNKPHNPFWNIALRNSCVLGDCGC